MILSAGLTPAWQQIMVLDRLRIGEVNRAESVRWCASGKVLNVAMAVRHLDADGSVLSLVGGHPRSAIEAEFAQQEVRSRWVQSERPTRVCTTVIDSESGVMTELVENAAEATDEELRTFANAFSEEATRANIVVLAGSLPASTPSDYYFRLISGITPRVILDGRGAELKAALPARPLLVKPNREELEKTLGRSVDATALESAMRELNALGAEFVLITSGQEEVWLTTDSQTWGFTPPTVDVVNAIGCGDCLAAGIAVGLDRGADMIEAVRLGMGAAGHNAEMLLPSRLDPGRVADLATQVTIRRV